MFVRAFVEERGLLKTFGVISNRGQGLAETFFFSGVVWRSSFRGDLRTRVGRENILPVKIVTYIVTQERFDILLSR